MALVSGGAGHIARAAAEALLEAGATVALVDANADAVQAAREQLGVPDRILTLTADLADEAQTRTVVRDTITRLGGLDVLIHTAALMTSVAQHGWNEPFDRQLTESWDLALRINLTTAFVLAQEAATSLAATGRGSVIFLSSIYGLVGPDLRIYEGTDMRNPVAYGVSKAGLVALARHLATTLAPRVRVNTITPGGVARGQARAFVEAYEQRTPLGRMAAEEDLKGAVAYLASDLSSYVTGHNLVVDGGWTAW